MKIPNLSQLSYSLFDGRPPLEPLKILREQTIEWASWRITFCILGASHAICWSRGEGGFTEILACLPHDYADILASKSLLSIPCVAEACSERGGPELQTDTHMPPEHCLSRYGLSHEFKLSLSKTNNNDLSALYGPDTISYDFPIENGSEGRPVTRIGWRSEDGSLAVETLHSYPEEGVRVRTMTTFYLVNRSMQREEAIAYGAG
jgi:hypothetical protein